MLAVPASLSVVVVGAVVVVVAEAVVAVAASRFEDETLEKDRVLSEWVVSVS